MIIYLHGFNSTGDSAKGQALKAALGNKISFYTPTYHYEPEQAINGLKSYIHEVLEQHAANEPRMIIGSSLGGFYAQYLARQFTGFKAVLINPALGPVSTLQKYIGENENFYTGEKYILQQIHINQLKQYRVDNPCSQGSKIIPTLVLLDQADEIIDYHFAYENYSPCSRVILFPGGDHQFQHLNEAIPVIQKFYLD